MMRNKLLIIPPLFLAGFICLPVLAAENEIKLGVSTAVRYNDNVANVESGKVDSFAFEIGPTLLYDRSDAKYELGASYSPRFTTYTQNGREDAFAHNMGVHGNFRLSNRWKVSVRDALSIEFDADRDFDNQTTSDDSGNGEKRTYRNNVNGAVVYTASQRTQLSSSVGYSIAEREDPDLADSSQLSGRLQGNYAFSARNTFGTGAIARSQLVEAGSDVRLGNNSRLGDNASQYYGFFVFAEHRFTPLLSMSGSGGPTWLLSNRENDGRSQKTSLDYFAAAELVAEIDRGSLSLSYERSSSDFAQTATAFRIDEISLRADWAATSLLIFGVSGEWNHRKSILRVRDSSFVNEVDQWRASATTSYRLTPELSTSLTFDYLRQNAKDAAPDSNKTDRYRAVLRFDYNAKAFRF